MVSEKDSQATAISLIGWFWCIVGVLICAGGFGSLYFEYVVSSSGVHTLSSFWSHFPVAGGIAAVFGLIGVVGGFAFMQRREWGRKLLRVLTALAFGAVCGVAIYWAFRCLIAWQWNIAVSASLVGIVNAIIMGVPLGIILKKLGADPVKSAMQHAEPAK